MRYKDMFTVLVVDSRIKRSRSLNDAFERILGNLVYPEEGEDGRVRLFTYVIRE
jgi:hypothetical protein